MRPPHRAGGREPNRRQQVGPDSQGGIQRLPSHPEAEEDIVCHVVGDRGIGEMGSHCCEARTFVAIDVLEGRFVVAPKTGDEFGIVGRRPGVDAGIGWHDPNIGT